MQKFGIVNNISVFYVGFSGRTDLCFLKLLKPGFRHCFLFFGDQYQTLVLDPLSNKIDISFLPFGVDVVKDNFQKQNIVVVKAFFQKNDSFLKFGLFTCVEVVKRILGISNIFVFTPFQLYCFLKK